MMREMREKCHLEALPRHGDIEEPPDAHHHAHLQRVVLILIHQVVHQPANTSNLSEEDRWQAIATTGDG